MWILKSSCSQSVGRNWSSQFGTLVSCGNGPFFHFSMLPTWNIDPICLHVKNPESLTTLSKGFQLSLVFFPYCFVHLLQHHHVFGDLKLQEKNSSNKKPKSRKFLRWTKFTKDWFSPFDMTPLLENCIIHSKSGVLLSVLLIQKSSIPHFSMLKFKTCRWCIWWNW